MPYFHQYPADEDPADLLDPENQVSTPWGGADEGPCDKCGGTGVTRYRCRSCLEEGADRECPACAGRVEYEATCPTCEGDGEIDRTRREGISAFPGLAGLYRYLIERDADLSASVILELDGELSGDVDLDADSGAVLVRPTAIRATRMVDEGRVEELRSRLAGGTWRG